MGKISPVSSKYIIHSTIEIDGVVDRPDVIGAIFGQTEGLLGPELELRELQRSGRIGRIEVNVDTRSGKTVGTIIIPSSLDKAETSIIAASLEVIQRIGPCNARVKIQNIEDVRVSKRNFIIERAKELLKTLMDNVLPDSQEIADEVAHSVRMMEIQEYGVDRLPAGSAIDESDEIIVVEGRADVLNLLKHGFKNVIAMNGTSCPKTIIELSRKKELVAFVDGDRGGSLIVKELLNVADVDYVARAPDGKEVEELTKKEIHKALRGKITAEQARLELALPANDTRNAIRKQTLAPIMGQLQLKPTLAQSVKAPLQPKNIETIPQTKLGEQELEKFRQMLDDLIGTHGAFILDNNMNILGKVPITELNTTLNSLGKGVYAVVLDGSVDKELVKIAERTGIVHIIARYNSTSAEESRVNIISGEQL
ncbi:MAG: DNA primase DnaG [Candidatus Woesearchaeota archaeon]